MRSFLVLAMLVNMVVPSRADDLTDLPEIACAEASTPLERQHIGCPEKTKVTAAQPTNDSDDAGNPALTWRLDTPEH